MPWLYERVPVEQAVNEGKGYSQRNCDIAELVELCYLRQGVVPERRFSSQVF